MFFTYKSFEFSTVLYIMETSNLNINLKTTANVWHNENIHKLYYNLVEQMDKN